MKKDFYVCVEYETIREYKVWKCKCNDNSDQNLMFAIANVILEEKNKFVKVKKAWFEKDI